MIVLLTNNLHTNTEMKKLLAAIAFAIVPFPALASQIVLDNSPEKVGARIYSDTFMNIFGVSWPQYFAQRFSFNRSTVLDGMDIYSSPFYGKVGSAALVTVWADNDGVPGSALQQFDTEISEIDSDGAVSGNNRKHADFTHFIAQAGVTYWIGLAGNKVELTQTVMDNGGSDVLYYAFPNPWLKSSNNAQLAYRLYGSDNPAASVPEPASLALFGLGAAGLVSLRRKHNSTKPVAVA
jgi:hypothetical protein